MQVMRSWGPAGLAMTMAMALALSCAGCADGPRPEEAAMSVETSRTNVRTALADVADVLSAAGHQITGATGKWRVCSAEPVASWQYSAGGLVTSPQAASVDAAVAAIVEVLQDGGWVVETQGTDPEPYANLEKDGLRLALGESRRDPGSVALGLKDECVETTSEQDSLLGEQDQLLD
ncbi:hypothetical protein [Nocardioides piscis]|uniref:Lipoprotein n=1 Tax=Nocardioides piscis TaxID=2714938 RepID=A0A6G7YK21_9ACTN|nr:hypothetical protein [Nocardioides piscis]QIK77089.1 hypothetical protein G7071_18260 [Nocardioides piscis]